MNTHIYKYTRTTAFISV